MCRLTECDFFFDLNRPSVILPSPDQYTVAVRFCPLIFELHEHTETNPPVINLPYRMIFAVATKCSVYLYDTQQKVPFGIISNIHYTRLTDLTWSSDGKMLLVSSTDGFCTLITFAKQELGTVYIKEDRMSEDMGECGQTSNNKENIIENCNDAEQSTGKPDAKPAEIINEPHTVVVLPNQSTTLNRDEVMETDLGARIISSNDKFESPKLKDLPVTPISIRKTREIKKNIDSKFSKECTAAPRTLTVALGTAQSPKLILAEKTVSPKRISDAKQMMANDVNVISTPPKTAAGPAKTPQNKSSKKATPISVHRKPRNTSAKPPKTNAVSEKSTPVGLNEDALDVWPIDQPRPVSLGLLENTAISTKLSESSIVAAPKNCPMDVDDTENLRLFYEDSQPSDSEIIEMAVDAIAESVATEATDSGVTTPNAKTPRRVEFRTISTPKSKKKLL